MQMSHERGQKLNAWSVYLQSKEDAGGERQRRNLKHRSTIVIRAFSRRRQKGKHLQWEVGDEYQITVGVDDRTEREQMENVLRQIWQLLAGRIMFSVCPKLNKDELLIIQLTSTSVYFVLSAGDKGFCLSVFIVLFRAKQAAFKFIVRDKPSAPSLALHWLISYELYTVNNGIPRSETYFHCNVNIK